MMNTIMMVMLTLTIALAPATEAQIIDDARAEINNIYGYYDECIVYNDACILVEDYNKCMDMIDDGKVEEAMEYAVTFLVRLNAVRTNNDWDYPELTLEEMKMTERYIRVSNEDRYNEFKYTREYIFPSK